MGSTERQVGAFLGLGALVAGSIVVAAVSPPTSTPERIVLVVGVFYVQAVALLGEFARLSSVGPGAMNGLYAVLAYLVWWVGSYLVVVEGFGLLRGEFRTVALTFLGLAVTLAAAGAALVGGATLFGVLGAVSGVVGAALAVGGVVVTMVALDTTARVHDAEVGWATEDLSYANTAVEVGAYLLLFAGLGLVGASVALGTGAQYLVLSLLGVAVAAVSVRV